MQASPPRATPCLHHPMCSSTHRAPPHQGTCPSCHAPPVTPLLCSCTPNNPLSVPQSTVAPPPSQGSVRLPSYWLLQGGVELLGNSAQPSTNHTSDSSAQPPTVLPQTLLGTCTHTRIPHRPQVGHRYEGAGEGKQPHPPPASTACASPQDSHAALLPRVETTPHTPPTHTRATLSVGPATSL